MKKRKAAALLAAFSLLTTALLGGCETTTEPAATGSADTTTVAVDDGASDSAGTSTEDTAALIGGCETTTEPAATGSADTTTVASDDGASDSAGTSTEDTALEDELKAMSALELSKKMGNGINLGNTLEAYNHSGYRAGQDPSGFEMGWGQPYTTPEMIQDMKDLGFDTIRIPVAWTNGMHFEDGDYTIDTRLMDRVEQVVNYALDAGMYVVINDHWDGGWWGMFGSADEAVRLQAMEMYKAMWSQIAERFGDYSYKLIFESANEELCERLNDSDITGSKGILTVNECYEKTYEINSEFVKLIRSTGGKNEDRFLLIAGYNTDIKMTCDDRYKMPEDTAKDKLLLSVHYYTPWDYCGTDGINQWGSPGDFKEQNELFEMMTKYTEQGYGIIIGEYAVMKSGAGLKPDTDKFYTNLLDNCDYYNYVPVLWDCSNLYKRSSGIVSDETVAAIFKDRQVANEPADYAEVQSTAKANLDAAYAAAEEEMSAGISVPASDDYAVAWIMYQSNDWTVAYSAGDTYDPTNKSTGVVDNNVIIEGEGTYTIGLDFTDLGGAKGTAFSAIGISNGETLFPGYIITIDEILIDGVPFEYEGKNYTSSDDGKCTRTNLYNQWVSKLPEGARIVGGDLAEASPTIMNLGKKKMNTLEVTFTFSAPEA